MMRTVVRAVLAGVAALTVTACGDSTPPAPQNFTINVTGNPNAADQARIQAGLKAFMVSCEPLFRKYWGDVVEAKATLGTVYDYTVEDHGWTGQMLRIEVKIAASTKAMPKHFYAGGHTLHYYAGNGIRPGLIAKKDQSAEACGMVPSRNGNDVFKPDPAFAVLAR